MTVVDNARHKCDKFKMMDFSQTFYWEGSSSWDSKRNSNSCGDENRTAG